MSTIYVKPNGEQEDIFEAILRENGFTIPFNYNIEIQVVGAFLNNPSRLDDFQQLVSTDIFYDRSIKRLFENICQNYINGDIGRISSDSLVRYTNDKHRDQVIGDVLDHLRHIPSDELTEMIKKLNDLAFRRKMLNAAFCILEDSYDEGASISNKVAYANEISHKIIQHITDFKKLHESLS